MSKKYRYIALIPILLLVARISDVALNMELSSGFYKSSNTEYHLAQLAVVIIAAVMLSHILKNYTPPKSDDIWLGGTGFVLFAASGFALGYANIRKLCEIIRMHPFHHFFMNREQLMQIGFSGGQFKFEFLCAVVGIAAAAWFVSASLPHFKGQTGLNGSRLFALVPVLWYCLRAVSMFVAAPINSRDSVAVSIMVSCIIMANLWYSIARYSAFSENKKQLQRISVCAFLSLVFTVAICIPNIVPLMSRAKAADAIMLAADALTAACGVYIADSIIKRSKEKTDVQ
ncbi:MAG: hypothetical protein RRZ42_01880 [Oscillospiraceae bacterium]